MTISQTNLHRAEVSALSLRNYWREERTKRARALAVAEEQLHITEESYEAIRAQVAASDAPEAPCETT